MAKQRQQPTNVQTIRPIRAGARSVYLVFFLSGIAGLSYEMVWARMFAVGLGHEFPSVLAVVAAFFGGFAAGAWALDGIVSRSAKPGLWYAAMELVIGAWALFTTALIPWANDQIATLTGATPSEPRMWLVAFAVPFAALAPATIAMGATLPAIDRLCCRLQRNGRSVGGLYAVNTFGALAGTLISTFVLIPAVGYRRTLIALALLNLICCGLVLWGPARGEHERPEPDTATPRGPRPIRLWATVFFTGLLGIGYEVLGVRIMAQALENTVFSFASALSIYLLGTAIGAAVYQRLAPAKDETRFLSTLLLALAAVTGLGVAILFQSIPIYESSRAAFGGGFAGSVAAEMVLALAVFGLPTVLMGMVFSHLAQMARRTGGGVGTALGLNTIGSSLAPVLFGVVLLPLVGSKIALLGIAAGYLLLQPRLRPLSMVACGGLLAAVAVFVPHLVLIEVPPGDKLLRVKEGVMAAVSVVESPYGPHPDEKRRLLKVNNKFQMGGTGPAEFSQRRQAHIPLMLHPHPRLALFLGLGTGVSFATAAVYPGLGAEGVELLPEIVEALPDFRAGNAAMFDSDRLIVRVSDARRYVRSTEQRYDVIFADLFQPARDGSGSLYTLEHFRAIRDRLSEGGLFCQWIPLFQMEEDVLKVVIRTFLQVFPNARGFVCDFNVQRPALGLVGTLGSVVYTPDWYDKHVLDSTQADSLVRCGLRTVYQLLGCYIASAEDLARFAGAGPLNTDDRPIVTFSAPKFIYRTGTYTFENLRAIMIACRPESGDLVDAAVAGPQASEFAARLDKYRAARDLFLQGAMASEQGLQEQAVDLQLSAVRTSADFRTAYDILIKTAQEQVRTQPALARHILTQLQQANPQRTEAAQLMRRFFGE